MSHRSPFDCHLEVIKLAVSSGRLARGRDLYVHQLSGFALYRTGRGFSAQLVGGFIVPQRLWLVSLLPQRHGEKELVLVRQLGFQLDGLAECRFGRFKIAGTVMTYCKCHPVFTRTRLKFDRCLSHTNDQLVIMPLRDGSEDET